MSKNKILLIFLALVVFAYCEGNITASNENDNNETESEPSDEEDREEFASFVKKISEEMGFSDTNKDVLISREKFKVFLKRVMTKDEKLEASEEQFYNEMVDKIAESVPDQVDNNEINKFLNEEYLMNILNNIIKEKYGEDTLNEFKQAADSAQQHPDL